MKITLEDSDNKKYEVGYQMILNTEIGSYEPLFWIDTEKEGVTIMLQKNQLNTLIDSLKFLKSNM